MALVLAERAAADEGYDPARVFGGYCAWWDHGKGVDAWDTGPIAGSLMKARALHGAVHAPGADGLKQLEERSKLLNRQLRGMTAGVNAVHRVGALALAVGALKTDAKLCD
jgi:hypothetical protein